MNGHTLRLITSLTFSLALVTATVVLACTRVFAQQCPVPELTSGLQVPLGITQTEKGNLFVAESGTLLPNTGRISIVDREGNRRDFLNGAPSGRNDIGEPSGPAGLFLSGNTLYVAIGVGSSVLNGGSLGTALPNPNPDSPLFSSILAIHFSSRVERATSAFTLTPAHHQALASGERVRLSNGDGDRITVELVVNFPNFIPEPLSTLPNNVRAANPFDLVLVEGEDRHEEHHRHHGNRRDDDDDNDEDRCRSELLYVTDGGRNLVWQVDINSGAFSILTVFPQVANPFMPTVFPPFIDAVPTGIAESQGQLLVTLFRGAPFPPGTSHVVQLNPFGGNPTPFITALKTAIDIFPIRKHGDIDYLVLQHASAGPFFGSPGLLLRFETPAGPPAVISSCLTRPTSMVLAKRTGTLYVTELIPVPPGQPAVAGRIVTINVVP